MKKNRFILSITLIAALITPIFSSNVNAATGYQGYAVYRDNAFINESGIWHAGIMDEPYSTIYAPVVQAPGFGSNVQYDTWGSFMKDYQSNFMGVYKPKAATTSYDRDLFVAMGRNLVSSYIPYSVNYQMYYDTATAGTFVDTNEISSMRCDGVVEYIYEWYGFRVYGNDTYWDITKNSYMGRSEHSYDFISPKSQAGYLTLVTSSIPKQ